MISCISTVLFQAGINLVKRSVDLTVEVVSGQMGYRRLVNIKTSFADAGKQYGPIAEAVGGLVGASVAGNLLRPVQQQSGVIKDVLREVGMQGVKKAFGESTTEKEGAKLKAENVTDKVNGKADEKADGVENQESGYMDTAAKLAPIVFIIAAGVAFPATSLAYALASKAPDIAKAFTDKVDPTQQGDFVETILIPGLENVVIQSTGIFLKGCVVYYVIEKNYNEKVQIGEEIGQRIANLAPEKAKDLLLKIGRVGGHIAASHGAMSEENVQHALNTGEAAKALFEASVEIVDMVQASKPEKTYWDTAKKVGILTATFSLVAFAPATAAIVALPALVSVTPQIITWARRQAQQEEKTEENLGDAIGDVNEEPQGDVDPLDSDVGMFAFSIGDF